MKKTLPLIVGLLFLIVVFFIITFYYNTYTIKDRADSLLSGDVEYSVIEKNYDSIKIYSSDDAEYYKYLLDKGVQCRYDTESIVEGDIECLHVTGYQHIYSIDSMGIHLKAFSNSNSVSYIKTLSSQKIETPFQFAKGKLSNLEPNRVTGIKEFIEYHPFQDGETKETILGQAKEKDYDGFFYSVDEGITAIETGKTYTLIYRKLDNAPLPINYYFQEGKPYYYITYYGGDCFLGLCGPRDHIVELFTK